MQAAGASPFPPRRGKLVGLPVKARLLLHEPLIFQVFAFCKVQWLTSFSSVNKKRPMLFHMGALSCVLLFLPVPFQSLIVHFKGFYDGVLDLLRGYIR